MNFIRKYRILIYVIIFALLTSCNKNKSEVDESIAYNIKSYFVINSDVKIFKDTHTSEIITKCSFFEPFILLSEDISKNGRIKIQLQNGKIGWIEEKNTSFIPKDWQQVSFDDLFYCYMISIGTIVFQEQQSQSHKVYSYKNSEYEVVMGVVYTNNYQKDATNKQKDIDREIKGGADKKLNWNKEFTFGNYKINYIITTDHPDGYISESFDFIKIDEIDLKKYYFISVDYNPVISIEKKLTYRKILFSIFQSLK